MSLREKICFQSLRTSEFAFNMISGNTIEDIEDVNLENLSALEDLPVNCHQKIVEDSLFKLL